MIQQPFGLTRAVYFKMKLFIFSSSTGCVSLGGGESYVEMLEKKYNPEGIWINGLTVLSARHYAKQFIKGNKRVVILHLGAVECFTRPLESFIIWCIREMGNWYNDPAWKEYFYYKLIQATISLEKKEQKYIQPLENFEFKKLYEDLLLILEGCKIIIIGMSKPKRPDPHWVEQASAFNDILKDLSVKYKTYFIDVFNKYDQYAIDSNHLNDEGHNLLYQEVDKILKSIKG